MKLRIATLFIALTAFNTNARDYNSVEKIERKDSQIILRKQIQEIVSTHGGSIDLLELKSGEIVYNNELKSFSFTDKDQTITLPMSFLRLPPSSFLKLPVTTNSSTINSKIKMPMTDANMGMVGGDGSGGG